MDSGGVGVASCGLQAAGKVVQGRGIGGVEPDVVAAAEVAREFEVAKRYQDGPCGVGDEGHAGFDEDVGPGLEPPGGAICRICGPGGGEIVGSKQGDDGLGLCEGMVEYLADVRAAAAGGLDELGPFAWFKADGAEPVE